MFGNYFFSFGNLVTYTKINCLKIQFCFHVKRYIALGTTVKFNNISWTGWFTLKHLFYDNNLRNTNKLLLFCYKIL